MPAAPGVATRSVKKHFRDKTVVLTGGSSGIGLATAHMLRQAGAHIVLVARDEGRLAAARTALQAVESSGEDVHTISLDVGDQAAVIESMATLPGGRAADVLISNAGVTMPGHFLELPIEEFERQMRINYFGAIYMTRALLPQMVERGSGQISYVSSLAGLMGIFGHTAYAPTKSALKGLAEALRCEMRPRGIGVSICYPSDTDTPQHDFELHYLPEETKAIAGTATLLRPEQVAAELLGGIAVGRFHIVPGRSNRFVDRMYRFFPGRLRSMFDNAVKKAGKRSALEVT